MEKQFTVHLLTNIWDSWDGESYEDYWDFSTAEEAVEKAEALAREYTVNIVALEVYNGFVDLWDYEDGWYGLDD